MATLTRGVTFTSTATAGMLNNLVDLASISDIQAADIATGAVTEDKIASGAVTSSKLATNSLKNLTFVDPTTPALVLSNASSAVYTSLDLTARTSANATAALLRVNVRDSAAAGVGLIFRKNSSSAYYYVAGVAVISASAYTSHYFLMPLDTGQTIEYQIEAGGAGTLDANVYVLGYMEDF